MRLRKAANAVLAKWPWMLVGGVFAVSGILVITRLATAPLPEMLQPAQSSKILATDGQVIATLHGEENRTIVPLDEISPLLQVALLYAEDREFFEHQGMSVRAVARAARANLEEGTISQGGSTLTQQLVRNTMPDIGKERTYIRKAKEAYWAMRLEAQMSKPKIMERYLNTVYFGRGAYGAEAAARTYFKISAAELTPGQAAFLAGVIRSPERYQIDRNPDGATQLRNNILNGMAEAGYLGPGEAESGVAEDLVAQYKPGMSIEVDSPRAGYFVEYVRRILKRDFGLSDEQILSGGLQIHTTLDLQMQDAAEEAVRSTLDSEDDPEAAMIAMDPKGRVRAMVGGRDVDSLDRLRGFNFAVDINNTGGGRQAGSAFKPLALAAFLEEGKSLSSTFNGMSPIKFEEGRCKNGEEPWEVGNFANTSFGAMDVTAATLSSVNTVYAQLMDNVVTPEKFIEIAGRTGIKIPEFDAGCALTLGTSDVTPLEMATAYTTFAQRGERPEPLVITAILRPDGSVVAERGPNVERVMETNVADSVNYVLERNIQAGTGTAARIGRPAAGKTGTTQNHQNAWFAGYTPELTTVVWMGYAPGPDGTIPEMTRVRGRQVTGGSFPALIWRRFMSEALTEVKASDFMRPKFGGELVRPKLVVPDTTLALADRPSDSGSSSSQPDTSGSSANPPPQPPPEPPRPSRSQPDRSAPERNETTDRLRQVVLPCFPFCD